MPSRASERQPSMARTTLVSCPTATSATRTAAREREDGFHGESPGRPSGQLDAIVLDHRVGEEPFAGVLQRALGLALVGGVELDVEDLALAHARDALDAERLERSLDRLPLRVEDAGFEGDGDTRFHAGSRRGVLGAG